jgi:hypothetical protein
MAGSCAVAENREFNREFAKLCPFLAAAKQGIRVIGLAKRDWKHCPEAILGSLLCPVE